MRCSTKTVWIFVIGIIVTNSLLLVKYYQMLQSTESQHPLDLQRQQQQQKQQNDNNNNNNNVQEQPPNVQSRKNVEKNNPPTVAAESPTITIAQKEQQQQDKLPTSNQKGQQELQEQVKPKTPYKGPVDGNSRFTLPELSQDSKSPWGRLLASYGITSEALNEETESLVDAADLLISKILPIRFWRLDPLVEKALVFGKDKEEIHDTQNRFRTMLRKVKHQASVMKFRWPWHLAHMYEKNEQNWIDSKDEIEQTLQSVKKEMMKSSPDAIHNIKRLDQLLLVNPDEIDFSEEVAKIIEQDLLNNEKLPVFTRKILSSRLRARKIFLNTGCNVVRLPFTNPTEDEKCINYLSDIKNWKQLKPLPVRYDARTIKFQIEFNEPDLHSVLKVPQRLFPFEAFAEIGAYHADRILGVRRIPPTAYACIPKTMIREMLKREGNSVETDDETLQESGVKSYSEMVEKDLLKFADKSAYNVDDHGDCVGVSVQPLMADVHHLLDSALVLPYKTHDRSWHNYFNLSSAAILKETKFGPFGESYDKKDFPLRFLRTPYVGTVLHIAEVVAFDFIVGNNDRSPNKNSFVAGSCVDDASVCSEDETSFFNVKDNNDLMKKNSNNNNNNNNKKNSKKGVAVTTTTKPNSGASTAAVGGGGEEMKSVEQESKVDWQNDRSAIRRAGPPSFIHIDQGMAFYQTPTDNALTKSLKAKDKSGFCVFRRRFVNRLLDLFGVEAETLSNGEKESVLKMIQRAAIDDEVKKKDGNGFSKLMQSSLPPRAMHSAVLTKSTLAHCEKRMRKVLLQISRCLAEHPIEEVIAP